MTTNKNQHFVPRCYLRPFTINGANLAINIFNLDRGKFISNAPVKNQCSGNYFYGKNPALEKAIQTMEGMYAATLRDVLAPRYALTESHRGFLRRFALFQYMRTEAASRRAVEMNSGLVDPLGPSAEKFRLDIKDAVQMAMKSYAELISLLDDLKLCLVRNRTDVPFVTSDDPAVLTNRWHFEDRRGAFKKSFGLSAAGTLLLLPISPKVVCICYDGDVYSISHTAGWVDIKNPQDAEAINQHQFLNCRANIYLQDLGTAVGIEKQWQSAHTQRPTAPFRVHYAIKDGEDGDHVRYKVIQRVPGPNDGEAIVHMQRIHPKPSSWPRFLAWKKKGIVYTNGTGVGYVRCSQIDPMSEMAYYAEAAGPER